MKKYLITGASGAISQIIRGKLKNDQVILWSRNKCDVGPNETWIKSESLENFEWWNAAPIEGNFDAIFHLAEPIKQSIKLNDLNKIIDSHTSFLEKASPFSKTILYPQTAYKYDRILSKNNFHYLKIKEITVSRIAAIKNLQTPIIHPLIDCGNGLSKIKYFVDLIPFFNIFCAFNSSIAVLNQDSFNQYIEQLTQGLATNEDWFSQKVTINELFFNENKMNSKLISRFLMIILRPFVGFQNINLLINGRNL